MTTQRRGQTSRALWRHRWQVLATIVLITGTTAVVSKRYTPVYSATAVLVVNQPAESSSSFDQFRATEAYARTLAQLIGRRNVAAEVVTELSFPLKATQALRLTRFSLVNETQLLEVHAESTDPAEAQELANTYARVFTRYASSNLRGAAPSTITVADTAPLPLQPTRPRPTLYTLVAFVFAVAVASALAMVRDRLDTRIEDADELERSFGLPVLAALPPRGSSARSHERFDEAIRVLRTNLQFASETPISALEITSVREGEGKSTVAAELARSFALLALYEGAVLVVDTDLRRPTLAAKLEVAGPSVEERGLSTYLRGEHRLADCVVGTSLVGLRVLPSGPQPENPSTLLGFAASREALANLTREAETVIFDTPPIKVGADASIVATAVDGVVMVIDLSLCRREELRESLDQLRRINATILGFVVNRHHRTRRAAHSSYYYYGDDGGRGQSAAMNVVRRVAGRRRPAVAVDRARPVAPTWQSYAIARERLADAATVSPVGERNRDGGEHEEGGLNGLNLVVRDRQSLQQEAGQRGADAYRRRVGGLATPTDFFHQGAHHESDPGEVGAEPQEAELDADVEKDVVDVGERAPALGDAKTKRVRLEFQGTDAEDRPLLD